MDPYEINVQFPRQRHQRLRSFLRNADLRHLPQIYVGGMDVDRNVRTAHILNSLMGNVLRCGTVRGTGKYPVHVQIEQRHTALDRVDAQRIQGWININGAAQIFGMLLKRLI